MSEFNKANPDYQVDDDDDEDTLGNALEAHKFPLPLLIEGLLDTDAKWPPCERADDNDDDDDN
jgi:hypothetical protein